MRDTEAPLEDCCIDDWTRHQAVFAAEVPVTQRAGANPAQGALDRQSLCELCVFAGAHFPGSAAAMRLASARTCDRGKRCTRTAAPRLDTAARSCRSG
jgi:hypothetical protein